MKRKEALKYIEKNLKVGSSRKKLFSELTSKITFHSDLVQYMTEIPLLSKKEIYKFYNYILLALLMIIFFEKLFFFIQLVSISKTNTIEILPGLILGGWIYFLQPFFVIFLILGVWKYRGPFYKFVVILSAFDSLNQLKNISAFTVNIKTFVMWSIFALPVFVSFIISWYIWKKMFPFMHWGETKKEELISYID